MTPTAFPGPRSILNPVGAFAIQPTAGVVSATGEPLDREVKDHYVLQLQVGTAG